MTCDSPHLYRLQLGTKFLLISQNGVAGSTCIACQRLPRFSSFVPATSQKSGSKGKSAQPSLNNHKASKSYTKSEVSTHNKRTDCWIIIKNKVYDVTSYVEEHPGGDAILAHAGDDSTEGFFGPQHATRVFDMIDDFYIGDLEQ
ncbi:cytochrome B5-like protein [Arachis duranensis]|uniref:Cytochrome B5-like protein n=1 Tax=Arachis duranensis TaxID=130453 RepID=A0A6P4DY17_ARADU|nr:cytochrome B5-like protein [Arachis duranensis]